MATIRLLSECRRECRDLIDDDYNEEMELFGGTGDYLDQQFGFRLPVCSLREGNNTISGIIILYPQGGLLGATYESNSDQLCEVY